MDLFIFHIRGMAVYMALIFAVLGQLTFWIRGNLIDIVPATEIVMGFFLFLMVFCIDKARPIISEKGGMVGLLMLGWVTGTVLQTVLCAFFYAFAPEPSGPPVAVTFCVIAAMLPSIGFLGMTLPVWKKFPPSEVDEEKDVFGEKK